MTVRLLSYISNVSHYASLVLIVLNVKKNITLRSVSRLPRHCALHHCPFADDTQSLRIGHPVPSHKIFSPFTQSIQSLYTGIQFLRIKCSMGSGLWALRIYKKKVFSSLFLLRENRIIIIKILRRRFFISEKSFQRRDLRDIE